MSLNTNIQRKIKALEKEVTIQLERALSVVGTDVGLDDLINEALSTAKTLSTLQDLVSASDIDSTPALETSAHAPHDTTVYVEADTVTPDADEAVAVPVPDYSTIGGQHRYDFPRSGETIFSQLSNTMGIERPGDKSISIETLEYR